MEPIMAESVGIAAFGILTDLLPALAKKGLLSTEEVKAILDSAEIAQRRAGTQANEEAAHLINTLQKSLAKI